VADSQQPEVPGRPRLPNVHRDGDLSPSPGGPPAQLTHRVFVSGEASLAVSFTAAQAWLESLIRGGLLGSASAQAYSDGITGLARAGPLGSAPGLPRLVQVHFQDLTARDDRAQVALRWELAGPGGELFPVLDADLMLTAAGEHSTTLALTGAYRPPPGTASGELDRAVMHRVATATIRAFLDRVTEAMVHPARGAEPQAAAADPDPAPLPPEPETP
jgi:hypothetical protein